MKNASRAFVQRIAMKPVMLLVVVSVAAVACAVIVIRHTHAANLRSGTTTAALAVPQGPSHSIVPGPSGLSTFKPVVTTSVANGISSAVRNLPVIKNLLPTKWETDKPLPIHPPHAPPTLPVQDTVQQTSPGLALMPSANQTFDGMAQGDACGGCIPPDPDGAIGPNNYVEMVNSAFAVYSKTGTLLSGPTNINQLFQGLPAGVPCRVDNDGDPIVVYDHLANRWVLTQFAVNGGSGPFDECIAVSQTGDPTGAYFVYDFHRSDTIFHDYPKFGVWPDAYYETTNEFDSTTANTFVGAGAHAFERDKMLLGQPAREVFFDLSTVNSGFGGMLPSDVDGVAPPVGSPNYFAEVDSQINSPALGADAMRIWKFTVNWTNPALSTFGLNGLPNSTLPVAMWTPAQCVAGHGTCVPQEGSPYNLDVLGDRLMFRLSYRNFGDHESLLINHSF